MTRELAVREETAVNTANQEIEFSQIRERLASVLKEQRNACVEVNGRLEITRPVALALLNQLSRSIASIGGKIYIKKDVLNFNPVVVKAICEVRLPNGAEMHFEALGSAEEGDIRGERRIYHDTIGTAETRATKRLLEEVVGEDFINRILAPLVDRQGQRQQRQVQRQISQKQANFIKSLARQTGVRISEISQQAIGREINSPEELMQITSQEATAIIEAYQNLQR